MGNLQKPNALESERELLAACFSGHGSTLNREDVIKIVTAETDAPFYVHPHYQKIYMGMVEAVRDGGSAVVDWGDVRNYIDEESAARQTLKKLVTEVSLPAFGRRWVDKHVKKLDDAYKCRRMLEIQQAANTLALAGMADQAFDQLMDGIFSLARDRFTTGAMPLTEYLPDIHKQIDERMINDGIVGLETGLAPLDEGLGGLQEKTLTYVGGRPGSMKSAALGQVAKTVSHNGNRVLVASPEMSAEQYTMRWACQMAGIPYADYNRGRYDAAAARRLHDAVEALHHKNIIINEGGLQSTATLRQDLIRFDPKLLIVDYAQLFEPSRPRDSEYSNVTMFSKELNAIKKDRKIAVLAAVQLSREVEKREDKRPVKSDIRSSGQVEQDADAIYMLYREREYASQDELGVWRMGDREINPQTLEWVCAKNRFGDRIDYMTYTREGDIWLYNEEPGGTMSEVYTQQEV